MRRACTIIGLLAVAGVLRAQSAPRVTVDAEQFDGAWILAPRADDGVRWMMRIRNSELRCKPVEHSAALYVV